MSQPILQQGRFQLAGLNFEIVTDDLALRTLLERDLLADFSIISGRSNDRTTQSDFVLEFFLHRETAEPLISSPLLPMQQQTLRLKRERFVTGWILGDYLHIQDGEHFLDLNYQSGRARGFFSREIFTTPRLLTHTYCLLAMVELLRSREVYFMHGACAVTPAGRGVLLLGDGGTGKSTTTYTLMRQGWSYVTDDTMLLMNDGRGRIKVLPLLKRFLLHGSLVHRFPGLALERLAEDGKGVVSPNSPGASARLTEAFPDRALLLKRQHYAHSRMVPVGKSALLAELIRQNPFLFLQSHLASRHLELLSQLCRQCDVGRLELGEDIITTPAKLVALLDRHERAHEQEQYF